MVTGGAGEGQVAGGATLLWGHLHMPPATPHHQGEVEGEVATGEEQVVEG